MTGAEQADGGRRGLAEFVKFIRYFLLAFGGVALFVGAFVIFNTLSITVAQRTRSSPRCARSARRAVRCSARSSSRHSQSGVRLGGRARLRLLIAKGLSELFAAIGLDLPQTAMVFRRARPWSQCCRARS